jgi:conjugative relaxase-like TrwC/TraI family protein
MSERPLTWQGDGAQYLGLAGTVSRQEYDCLFAPGGARHPATGELLARTLRPGWEIVVSTPKSVSVLWALGDEHREHAQAILDATASAEVEYLDRVAKAVGGRRGHAGVERTGTHGLVYATADHFLSRSLDPHLHRHILVANLVTRDDDGLTRAADLSLLTSLSRGSTMAGRVAGAYAARELGYRLEPCADGDGNPTEWRIAGIPADLEELWSTRAAQIADLAHRRGVDTRDWQARQAIARETRLAKQHVAVADRESQWRQDAQAHPVDLDRAVDRPMPAPADIEDKRFYRQDVEWAVGPSLYGQHPAMLDVEADGRLGDMRAVELARADIFRGRLHTTLTALEREHAIRDCVERIMGRGAVELIVGVAGAGKTTAAGDIARQYEDDDWAVLGAATAGAAARNLAETADVDASTIAALRRSVDAGHQRLTARTLLVLDEAGMVDDPDFLCLLRAAEQAGSHVILVGDHRQLSAVGPGGSFEALVDRWPDAVHHLADNRRQVDGGERNALEQLRAGDVNRAVDWYRHHSRIATAPDWDAAIDLAADRWAERSADTGLYAHRRSDVAALNDACRQRMAQAGRIDLDREVERFAPGDWVVQLAPDHRRGLVNGQHGIVVDTDPQAGRVDVAWDDGRRITLADTALDEHHLAYGYCTTVHKAQGQSVDHAIFFADGGGRELAYVGMSRSRHEAEVVAVADDVDQAVEQLRDDWQSERRERWVIDTEQTLADALDRLERATTANLADALDESTLDPLHRAMRSLARSQDDELTLER